MSKMAVLLIVGGLAVGLWLGFNPTTHKDLVRLWNSASVSQAHAQSPALISLRQLDASVARLFRSAPKPRVAPKTQPGSQSVGSQIGALLQAFWHAVVKIFLNILAQINKLNP